ncbi:hypothetical protein ABT010_09195 [Streptomyces sp. NPDC002668]|uniref:hypothetical protein n=1 Tax=Streptomyces sp. NPDC002668 TaxID=3154422 RepID=UPI003332636B
MLTEGRVLDRRVVGGLVSGVTAMVSWLEEIDGGRPALREEIRELRARMEELTRLINDLTPEEPHPFFSGIR